MDHPELLLPEAIRQKASISSNEYAWKIEDIEETLLAAKRANLASIGGEVQFRFDDGEAEPYWLGFDSGEQLPGESWEQYVERSAQKVLEHIQRLYRETDFLQIAKEWDFIQKKIRQGINPLDHLYFMLDFLAPTDKS
ncbi:MAG: hypothetical protein K2X81_27280 [Candidatus Obscuribacterales bacterium]|nr:hypothetical protein [Candidatus Obscuribacterales bacterium]